METAPESSVSGLPNLYFYRRPDAT